jgi:hypothetical protein
LPLASFFSLETTKSMRPTPRRNRLLAPFGLLNLHKSRPGYISRWGFDPPSHPETGPSTNLLGPFCCLRATSKITILISVLSCVIEAAPSATPTDCDQRGERGEQRRPRADDNHHRTAFSASSLFLVVDEGLVKRQKIAHQILDLHLVTMDEISALKAYHSKASLGLLS